MATLQEEIGKIIERRLLAGTAVSIPEVGTLYVERQPARKLSATTLMPPCRALVFRFDHGGVALPEIIAQEAACSLEEAKDACERWMEKSRLEQQLRIEGVGLLCGKLFTVEASFQRKLNPQGVEPIRIKGSMPWWAWSLITVVVVALLTGGIVWWLNPTTWWSDRKKGGDNIAEAIVEQPDTTMIEEVVQLPQKPKPLTDALYRPSEIIKTRSGKSYVVLGLYSTEENARRAIAQAEEAYNLVEGECCIFSYAKTQFLVSLGECDKRAEAKAIAARYREERGAKEVWVYSKN